MTTSLEPPVLCLCCHLALLITLGMLLFMAFEMFSPFWGQLRFNFFQEALPAPDLVLAYRSTDSDGPHVLH